ncbi:MAG: LuxR C-terminal-related transcriptional regulator [Ignavibacteria bacterium]|nr:LuxR C-terminal-related transcriptional regulator [Ignavibacteria bacterium]
MNKLTKNIAVLEPSQIVFEGLSNVLSKSGQQFHLLRTDNLNEIQNLAALGKLELAIINPSQIQNKNKEFLAAKKNHPGIVWVALIYNFFDQQLLSLFDKVINITDSGESIAEQIKNLSNSEIHSNDVEHEQLSEREIDVLKLIVKGFSNKEIADNLNISIHTVISHRKNISQKTGIKSQSGLTIYAISNKIILIEDFAK